MNRTDMKNVAVALKNLQDTLGDISLTYYLDKMDEYYKGCMKASKFKIGDRVALKEAWDGDAPGWQHCKHFLIPNNHATVQSYDYVNGKYVYDIEFDKETYKATYVGGCDYREIADKHTFRFTQKELRKV